MLRYTCRNILLLVGIISGCAENGAPREPNSAADAAAIERAEVVQSEPTQAAAAQVDEATESERAHLDRVYRAVAYHKDSADVLKPMADEIETFIGTALRFQPMTRNPTCCVWLEITHWNPNPGGPGYVIINQAGGSIIEASNAEQMKLAVARFKSSARRVNGELLVPQGLLTSYRVVP